MVKRLADSILLASLCLLLATACGEKQPLVPPPPEVKPPLEQGGAGSAPRGGADPLEGTSLQVPAGVHVEAVRVYFARDESALTEASREALSDLHRAMARGGRVTVEGHCDERGTTEYNLALGWRRATSVRDYLVALGIDADRIDALSFGEELPAARGHDESAWSLNRRVEIRGR